MSACVSAKRMPSSERRQVSQRNPIAPGASGIATLRPIHFDTRAERARTVSR